jgi:hypothetical protein
MSIPQNSIPNDTKRHDAASKLSRTDTRMRILPQPLPAVVDSHAVPPVFVREQFLAPINFGEFSMTRIPAARRNG